LLAETFEGRRAEKIAIYEEILEVAVREKQHIEADAGADTKTTTKMRKRKITCIIINKGSRDPHVAQRAPTRGILA
jgi:hypothetical protein